MAMSVGGLASATIVPRAAWAQKPAPKHITDAWQAFERAVNSGDALKLIRARLDIGSLYTIVSPDHNDEDRIVAFRLLEANFDPRVEQLNKQIAGLSRFYWARAMIQLQDRKVRKSMLPRIRQELRNAARMLLPDPRFEFEIGPVAAIAAFLAGDLPDAASWIELAYRRADKIPPLAVKDYEALQLMKLSELIMLRARLASLQGQAEFCAYQTELAIEITPTGGESANGPSKRGAKQFLTDLAAASRRFDAVVHLATTVAGSAIVISRQEAGQTRSTVHDLKAAHGGSFDGQDIEELQWGRPLREAYKAGFFGGWQGIFLAMDSESGNGSGPTFRRGLPNMATRFWSTYAGQIAALLAARGVAAGSRVALILPNGLTQFPLRIARNASTGRSFNEQFVVSEAADCASLALPHRVRPRPERSLIGLFNPVGDLPGADAEKSLLAPMLGNGRLGEMRGGMTGAAFMSEIARSNADYIYLATHGSFGVTEAAGLKLGPRSTLGFEDILASKVRLQARLAILSACETAVVQPEALSKVSQSLPNILLGKGVQGVVASLWKVSDDSTALLMHNMMQRHLVDSIEPPEALRDAQRWLSAATGEHLVQYLADIMDRHPERDWSAVAEMAARLSAIDPASRPFAEPYHWGAFAYYGS